MNENCQPQNIRLHRIETDDGCQRRKVVLQRDRKPALCANMRLPAGQHLFKVVSDFGQAAILGKLFEVLKAEEITGLGQVVTHTPLQTPQSRRADQQAQHQHTQPHRVFRAAFGQFSHGFGFNLFAQRKIDLGSLPFAFTHTARLGRLTKGVINQVIQVWHTALDAVGVTHIIKAHLSSCVGRQNLCPHRANNCR